MNYFNIGYSAYWSKFELDVLDEMLLPEDAEQFSLGYTKAKQEHERQSK